MPYTRTTLTNIRSGRSITGKQVFRITGQGRAKLKAVDSPEIIEVAFPFGPRDIKIDNRVAKIVEIERPGRKPILAVERPSLVTLGFSAIIADKKSGGASPNVVDDVLQSLYNISEEGYQCKFVYGLASYPFVFRITKLTVTEVIKNADGRTIRANVDIQLTESAAYNPKLVDLNIVTFEPEIIPRIPAPKEEEDNPYANYAYLSGFNDQSIGQMQEGLRRGTEESREAYVSYVASVASLYGYGS